MADQFTTRTQEALQRRGARRRAAGATPRSSRVHVLRALLDQRDGIAVALLEGLGVDVDALARAGASARSPRCRSPRARPWPAPTSPRPRTRCSRPPATSPRTRGDSFVSTEHVLIALAAPEAADRPDAGCAAGVTPDALSTALDAARGGRRVDSADPEGSFQALEKYGVDLTARAREGKIDPVIGRDAEIRRVIQVLSPAHQEQPGPDRRARRRQDRRRRGPGAAHRRRRRARVAARQAPDLPRPRRRWSPARSTAASSRSGSRPCSRRSRTPTARSSRSSTSCTPSSVRAPAATRRWTPATCSSRCWPAASCAWSARPRSTSTASASRRTPPSSAASSRCSSASRASRTPSASCAASRRSTRRTTRSRSPTPRWSPRPRCPTATSPAGSCPTRRSTSSTRRRRGCAWRSTPRPVEIDAAAAPGRPAADGGARAGQGDRRGQRRAAGQAARRPGRQGGAAARPARPLGRRRRPAWTGSVT